ncbi:LytR/AlgR family response regulator transcription factor [Clostridium botulinum]|uniref:LytR/AlgR family response regulator transcription factor n=1 Tax=Clostridium botulinum TaxID=1491 RepID=UPI002491CB42|nr:LytTR family DNA-binding domain-containing protein [Clostridium botulinum]BDB00519.1 DNA-binding response regulator [Clostridium botulinum]
MRIGICGNDVEQRNYLKNHLIKIIKETELECELLEFDCGEELLKNYGNMNIIFLDINMGKINGIEIAKKIREFDSVVEIIFVTKLVNYIHQAYEVRAYRYLLRPINYEIIKYVTLNCIKGIEAQKNLVIKYKGEIIILNIDEITYIEVMQKMLTIHTKDKDYTFKMTLSKFEKELSQHDFFRCHKSFLVNLNKVKEFKDNIINVNDTYIPISKYRLKEFRHKLTKILKNSIWL